MCVCTRNCIWVEFWRESWEKIFEMKETAWKKGGKWGKAVWLQKIIISLDWHEWQGREWWELKVKEEFLYSMKTDISSLTSFCRQRESTELFVQRIDFLYTIIEFNLTAISNQGQHGVIWFLWGNCSSFLYNNAELFPPKMAVNKTKTII